MELTALPSSIRCGSSSAVSSLTARSACNGSGSWRSIYYSQSSLHLSSLFTAPKDGLVILYSAFQSSSPWCSHLPSSTVRTSSSNLTNYSTWTNNSLSIIRPMPLLDWPLMLLDFFLLCLSTSALRRVKVGIDNKTWRWSMLSEKVQQFKTWCMWWDLEWCCCASCSSSLTCLLLNQGKIELRPLGI